MDERANKWESRKTVDHIESVPVTHEFFGACRNHRNCKQFSTVLGNGYCAECWDKGLGSKAGDLEWLPKHG